MATYRLHGLTLASPWRLSAPRVEGEPEFEISFEGKRDTARAIDAPLLADGRGQVGRTAAYGDWPRKGAATIRFTDVAEFEVDERAGTVRAWVHPGIDERFLPILLEGNVPAFILGLRNAPVLHAAAVTLDGRTAIGIAGVVGQGKTTTAALLCEAGAGLITDDTMRLSLAEEILVHQGTTSLRFRQVAGEVAGWLSQEEPAMTVDERIRVEPEPAEADLLPLAGILIPAPDRDLDRVEIEPVPGGQAARALLAAARFASWTDTAKLRDHLDLVARIAATVPAYWARIPWGPPFDRAVARELADRLATLQRADR